MNPNNQPLALRMRPKTLQDVVGQQHILGANTLIANMVNAGLIRPFLLYGSPGIGKTSIAQALAGSMKQPLHLANAATDGKKALAAIIDPIHADPSRHGEILFIDEIHRLTKVIQDYLLPFVENGTIILIGATTENPHISVAPAVRSRMTILQLQPLTEDDVITGLRRALDTGNPDGLYAILYADCTPEERRQKPSIYVEDDVLVLIARTSSGDMRQAYNILETASFVSDKNEITEADVKNVAPHAHSGGDKSGDSHYNLLSAFQKSIRGSDVDASIYYLARLLHDGDLVSVLRRLRIIAYEDIGIADKEVVNFAINACDVAEKTGLPEAAIPLGTATMALALALKSYHGYRAIGDAMAFVAEQQHPIPMHLRDTHFKGAEQYGHTGYVYPHEQPYGIAAQTYLPDDIKHVQFMPPILPANRQDALGDIGKRYQNVHNFINEP